MHERNLRRPVCRLPVEMLVKCLSFLTAKDQLSIIRVCRHLRTHAIEAPLLWTCVDQIHHPTALAFVLERTKNSPVDIINLHITEQSDPKLQIVSSHMHHLRILNFHFGFGLRIESRDFATPAPLLERLSFNNTAPALGYLTDVLSARRYPKLSRIQLNEIEFQGITWSTFQAVQNLRTFSIGRRCGLSASFLAHVSHHLPNVTTVNLQLDKWAVHLGANTPAPALRRVNIRWTGPDAFSPADVFPYPEAWNTVRAVHVTHVGNSLSGNFPIPAEAKPYRSLWVRTSVTGSQQVHIRVVHEDGRERVFCGLHPTAVSGIATRIPGLELTTMTVATTAVALNVLSNSSWPSMRRMRLISDTHDTAWVKILARDIFNIPTLQHLELSIDPYAVSSWETPIALRVLGCCIAAGHALQKVTFLGFAPEPRCVAGAELFADEVTVDRWWREPEDERVWFTEPAFEW